MKKQYTDTLIHKKLYKNTLFIALILSIVSITANFMSGLPIFENVKWLILLILSTIALAMVEFDKYTEIAKFSLFCVVIWLIIPQGLLEAGSSKSVTYSYLMLIVILVSLLFAGVRRLFLLISIIVVFLVLHFIDYNYIDRLSVYSKEAYFIDQLIQLPFIILAAFYILIRYTNEYIKMNQRLDELANIDGLTNLYNRRAFDKAILDIDKFKIPNVQLGFIDVDNFKQLNDRYGHSIGDEALRVLSNFMKQHINPSQHVLARWGGDEFAIIYYGNKSCLENHLTKIKENFINYAMNYLPIINISMSVISFSDYGSFNEAMMEADKLLYKDKKNKIK